MKKYSAIILALVLGLSALGSLSAVYAAGGGDAIIAQQVTNEDAAKKYPPPAGKSYPEGISTSTTTGGFFQSPYSGKTYDCRKVKKKALVLDASVNKVFIRP